MSPKLSAIIHRLQAMNRPGFAEVLEKWGEQPRDDYGRSWWKLPVRPPPLEPELIQAFEQTWREQGWEEERIALVQQEFLRWRLLQTTTHLTPTEGPTFLACHALATNQQPSDAHYLVATFSGVPFSNSAWSGSLSYGAQTRLEQVLSPQSRLFRQVLRADQDRLRDGGDRRVSLLPGSWRDGLVYDSAVPETLRELYSDLLPEESGPLRSIALGENYSQWALQYCEQITRSVLQNQRIHFCDLNQVIGKYLKKSWVDPEHWLRSLLSRKEVALTEFDFEKTPIFFRESEVQKKKKIEPIYLRENQLLLKNQQRIGALDQLVEILENSRICPGLLLCILVLRKNQIRLLGGFEQIEYSRELEEKLNQSPVFADQMEQEEWSNLTTGRCFYEGEAIYPLDLYLGGRSLEKFEGCTLSWFEPILQNLKPREARF